MNKDIKICFMGSPLFGKIVLEKLIENFNVVLVVTQPDSSTKGGRVIIEQPVKKLAMEYNIPIFQPANIKENFSVMQEYDFDYIVTAAYGQFIPLDVLHLPKKLTLNVHGSLLPKYRGGAPIQRAIENGDEYLGVTIMRTILKMDAGVIYKQSKIKLEDSDNYETMTYKLASQGALDIVEVLENMYVNSESITPIHQDTSLVTFAPNISKNEEILRFSENARNIFNKIRAFNPNPLTYFIHKEQAYKVYSSMVILDDSKTAPGTILDNKKSLIIKCKENALKILEIQPSGKQKMDIVSFLNGYRNKFEINSIIE